MQDLMSAIVAGGTDTRNMIAAGIFVILGLAASVVISRWLKTHQ
jgi:hypothetical protein